MKNLKHVLILALISFGTLGFNGCTEDEVSKSCEQQDMNEILNCGEQKNVEVCCTEGSDCVYSYNGIDYPNTSQGLSDLADALGCTTTKSADYEEQHALVIMHLKKMMENAKATSL